MALQSSGAISLNDIHIEAGGSSGSNCSINDADIRALISKGSGSQMSFSEWYGASGVTTEGPFFVQAGYNQSGRKISQVYLEWGNEEIEWWQFDNTGNNNPSGTSWFSGWSGGVPTLFNFNGGGLAQGGWNHFVRSPMQSGDVQFGGWVDEGVYMIDCRIWRTTSSTYPL
tara:strand:- start:2344 stop:2853 length:510 start_codon:yes stop_codon:yes gene_type:complete